MTQLPSPSGSKFHLDNGNSKIMGVCSGIANYTGWTALVSNSSDPLGNQGGHRGAGHPRRNALRRLSAADELRGLPVDGQRPKPLISVEFETRKSI